MRKHIATYELKWTGKNFENFFIISKMAVIESAVYDSNAINGFITLRPFNSKSSITVGINDTLIVSMYDNGDCFFAIAINMDRGKK